MAESIFTDQVPASGDVLEPGGINTAVTVVPAVGGTITGIRFFAPITVSGTFTGELYEPTTDDDPAGSGQGTLLGSGTLTAASVTPGAWNVIPLSSPVPVTGGMPYRANRHSTNGRYVATSGAFASAGITNGNLTAPQNGTNSGGLGSLWNGTFRTGAAPAYPSDAFGGGNYFVDVVFEAAAANEGAADYPLQIILSATGVTPGGNGQGAVAFTLDMAAAITGSNAEPPIDTGVCGWSIDPDELGVCDEWAGRSLAVRTAALQLASRFLWAATGRQYGVCEMTIQPRQNMLSPEIYRDYPIWPGQDPVVSGPYLFGGRWFNRGCGSCCNSGGCAIVLRGPVASVTSVVVAGETVEESAYRVDLSKGAYLLVRADGLCWPSCGTEPGDFQVTYGIGRELPAALQVAVALLACEYAKHLAGGACALPARMTRLSRQGVEIEVDAGDGAAGTTGVRQVDDVIAALNPGRRQSPPVVLSPDLPESCDRVTVWGA